MRELSNKPLIEKIVHLRQSFLRSKKVFTNDELDRPVSYWIKTERLLNEIGKEIVIILKTKGCSWALGENGGCSMCGYIQDSNIHKVKPFHIINQFNHALEDKLEEIEKDDEKYILKIFNSGSFFDDEEVPKNIRKHIFESIDKIKNIKEVVVESRTDHIKPENLQEIKEITNKYVEIGIGIESTNDYIRKNYINKGLSFSDFLKAVEICKNQDIGIKAYLLFKPPFINEIGAIDDCKKSITDLIDLNINTISINPVNIQRGSLVEYLWYQNRYRPPWFYSLFECLKKALSADILKRTRILSDPSGAGTKRGIHNCLRRECNEKMITLLRNFVLSQNLNDLYKIDQIDECECKITYFLQRELM